MIPQNSNSKKDKTVASLQLCFLNCHVSQDCKYCLCYKVGSMFVHELKLSMYQFEFCDFPWKFLIVLSVLERFMNDKIESSIVDRENVNHRFVPIIFEILVLISCTNNFCSVFCNKFLHFYSCRGQ